MPWLRGTSSGVGAQGPGVCLYFLHFYLFICNPYEEAGTEVSHGPGDLVARWTFGGQFMGRLSLCSDRFCFTEHSVTHHSTFLPTKAPFHSHFPISEYTLLCGFGCTGFTLLLGKSSPVLFLLGHDPAGCGRIPKLHMGTRERE